MKFSSFARNASSGPFKRRTLAIIALCALFAGCAKPRDYTYYPPEPQPPRLQFLTAFSSESDLKLNKIVKTLTGTDVGMRLERGVDIAHYQDKIFVAQPSKQAGGYAVFDLTQKKMNFVAGPLIQPLSISVDDKGYRYVADGGLNAVIVFDTNDTAVNKFASQAKNFRPSSAVVHGDRLYVCDIANNLIRVFDLASKEELFTFGQDKLWWPNNITVSPYDGNLVVTQTGAAQVSVFTPDGELALNFGKIGDTPGSFIRPKAADVDRDGNFYVTDTAFQNVQILNKQGLVRMAFGSPDEGISNMIMPAGVHIDYDNAKHFEQFIAPGFQVEYLVYVTSQGALNWGDSKVNVYAFGRMEGADYSAYED